LISGKRRKNTPESHAFGGEFLVPKFGEQATYRHAVTSISALYILIFYLAKIEDLTFRDYDSKYIDSNYCYGHLLVSPSEQLPGFEKDKSEPIDLDHFSLSWMSANKNSR